MSALLVIFEVTEKKKTISISSNALLVYHSRLMQLKTRMAGENPCPHPPAVTLTALTVV